MCLINIDFWFIWRALFFDSIRDYIVILTGFQAWNLIPVKIEWMHSIILNYMIYFFFPVEKNYLVEALILEEIQK